ncbi:hypothetical protein B7494_g5706 [Chlorociboria aeruginascens]|nr:hypothetical protein B7494_g5706 [Chlorociboria aeruginascens]
MSWNLFDKNIRNEFGLADLNLVLQKLFEELDSGQQDQIQHTPVQQAPIQDTPIQSKRKLDKLSQGRASFSQYFASMAKKLGEIPKNVIAAAPKRMEDDKAKMKEEFAADWKRTHSNASAFTIAGDDEVQNASSPASNGNIIAAAPVGTTHSNASASAIAGDDEVQNASPPASNGNTQ